MDTTEAQASLRLLRAVANADGAIDDDEGRALDVAALRALAGYAQAGWRPDDVDVDAELGRIHSEDARAATFHAAVAMACVDGRCSHEERSLLQRIHDALAIPEALDVVEVNADERVRDARRAIASATEEFLRQVGQATNEGGLTQERYEAFVAELERRKRALLAAAVLYG